LNRNKAPKTAEEITIGNIEPIAARLGNSVPLYMIQAGSQQVVRIEIVFGAGSWWQSKPLVASSTNAMLSEGTINFTGEEIAKKLDFYGAYLDSSAGKDNAYLSLYSLARHLGKILPLLAEIIKSPAFPEKEFSTYLERRKQDFVTEKARVNILARDRFAQALYGSSHPYGQSLSESDFGKISREDLVEFHQRHYNSGNCTIIVTGRYDENELAGMIDALFGGNDWPAEGEKILTPVRKRSSRKQQIFIPKKDAVQSALRIGRILFDMKHPDYYGMLVLNNILGGHFGSRLMQNIREKKGYTYGIGSAVASLKNSGFFVIFSEVGNKHREASVREVFRELNKLRTKPVSYRELELTRSHMLGEVLRGFDGPFPQAESIRNLIENDLDARFYQEMVRVIRFITPAELRDLALKYLSPGDMYVVVAGNK
jgi:zinc protease